MNRQALNENNVRDFNENLDDFCIKCETILPIPEKKGGVKCVVCGHPVSINKFLNRGYNYTIKFDGAELESAGNTDTVLDNGGQMDLDRECSKCNHKGMSYTTMQLRSADEGQTIYYFCPKCQNREVENS